MAGKVRFIMWEPGKPIEIETERFYLRVLTPDDVTEDYISWWNDAEIQKGFGQEPRNYTRQHAERHISMFKNKESFHLGIYKKGTDRLIGFYTLTFNAVHKISTTNICIGDKTIWNQGVAFEILDAGLKFRFEEMGVEKIAGEVNGENRASMALFDKLGFAKEGTLRSQKLAPGGKRIDVYLYGLLKNEWQERSVI